MPEAEGASLGSDGISSGTPPGDARCYALRAFSSAPVLPAETSRRTRHLRLTQSLATPGTLHPLKIYPLDQIRRDRESALRALLI